MEKAWVAAVQRKRPAALDLTSRKDREEIRDPALLAAIAAARESERDPRGLAEVLVALSMQEGWSDAEVAVLLASTVEPYERLFRAARGDRLGLLVSTCLRFTSAEGHEAEGAAGWSNQSAETVSRPWSDPGLER